MVNCLVKLAEEKSVVRLTDRLEKPIAVDRDVKQQTKLKQFLLHNSKNDSKTII